MPEVLNRYKASPKLAGSVYIGRGSPYGNPFVIGKDGNRTEVLLKYDAWIRTQPELIAKIKAELKGRDLQCFCAPNACHGETILAIANASS